MGDSEADESRYGSLDDDCSDDNNDLIDLITHQSLTIDRLLIALDDAINCPKGIVPKSAEPFWDGQFGTTRNRRSIMQ